MKAIFTRGELPALIQIMRQITGFKKPITCINFGQDIGKVKKAIEETEAAHKAAKPASYDKLAEEVKAFQETNINKAEVSEATPDGQVAIDFAKVLKEWPKAAEWMKAQNEYEAIRQKINSEKVTLTFKTIIPENELPDVSTSVIGEVLSYFVKQ